MAPSVELGNVLAQEGPCGRPRAATALKPLRSLFVVLILLTPVFAAAQSQLEEIEKPPKGDVLSDTPDRGTQLDQLRHAVTRLPVAAGLACVLAFRPRR